MATAMVFDYSASWMYMTTSLIKPRSAATSTALRTAEGIGQATWGIVPSVAR